MDSQRSSGTRGVTIVVTRVLVSCGDPVPGCVQHNAYKNLIAFIILGTAIDKADRDRLVLVAGALFSVPFILFSMTGGFLADRYSKRTVTIGTKLFEIGVMAFAIAGLAWQNLHLEMAAIFLASTQAAFFGPSKYGLLPELLLEPRLSRMA